MEKINEDFLADPGNSKTSKILCTVHRLTESDESAISKIIKGRDISITENFITVELTEAQIQKLRNSNVMVTTDSGNSNELLLS